MIAGDARRYWDELNMRQIINGEVQEVERKWHAGELQWTFRTVMSLITPYPKRNEMDEWRPGMDDEATPDPDGVPYLLEADEEAAEDEDEEDILDIDPADWHDPRWLEHRANVAGENRGSGQGDQSGGGGGEHR